MRSSAMSLGSDLLGDAVVGEIDIFHAELVGQGLGDLLFLDDAGLDEGFAEAFARMRGP